MVDCLVNVHGAKELDDDKYRQDYEEKLSKIEKPSFYVPPIARNGKNDLPHAYQTLDYQILEPEQDLTRIGEGAITEEQAQELTREYDKIWAIGGYTNQCLDRFIKSIKKYRSEETEISVDPQLSIVTDFNQGRKFSLEEIKNNFGENSEAMENTVPSTVREGEANLEYLIQNDK